jgi:hypothetical protein
MNGKKLKMEKSKKDQLIINSYVMNGKGKIWKWKKSKKDQLIINSYVMNGKKWKREKRQQVARFEPWPPQKKQGHLPLSYQSVCDFGLWFLCLCGLFIQWIFRF